MPVYWERLRPGFLLNDQMLELVFAVNTLAPLKTEVLLRTCNQSTKEDCFDESGLASMQITANQVTFIPNEQAALNMGIVAMNRV